MNDKLLSLRRKALIISSNKMRSESGAPEIDEATISKILDLRVEFDQTFAELIIKECVDLLKEEQLCYESPRTYEDDEYYARREAKAEAYEDAISMINYHFGIKS